MKPRRRPAWVLPFAATFLVVLAFAVVSTGESAGGGPAAGHAPGPRAKGPSDAYLDICAQGAKKYADQDYAAAVAAFSKAIAMDSQEPLGHYLRGEAELTAGNFAEAEASYNRALSVSEDASPMHGRVLFVLADLRERQKKRDTVSSPPSHPPALAAWDQVKAAWDAYQRWAAEHPSVISFPRSAQTRVRDIDRMLAQDRAYEIVRQRIKETQDGGVYNDLSKSKPQGK